MQNPALRTDPTVPEGGTIVVTVGSGTEFVYFLAPGHRRVAVPVVNGRAEYRLPPSVQGGTTVYVSDLRLPQPASANVLVVGGQNR